MKKHVPALTLALLMIPASGGGPGCGCAPGSCDLSLVLPGTPCRDDRVRVRGSSGSGCCGQCRMEKAAGVKREEKIARAFHSGSGETVKGSIRPPPSGGMHGAVFQKTPPLGPSFYLTGKVMPDTFSLRAPPAG